MKVMAQKSEQNHHQIPHLELHLQFGWAVFNADCQAPNQQAAADGSCANDNDDDKDEDRDDGDDDGDDDDGGDSKY